MSEVSPAKGRKRSDGDTRLGLAALKERAQGLPLSEGILPPDVNVDLGAMSNSIAFQLRQTSWAVHAAFGFRFAPSNVIPRQYSVLYLVGKNPGINVKSLAAAIGVDQSTLVPTLNACEAQRWIVRSRSQSDRRVTVLQLTDQGEQTVTQMRDDLDAHERAVTDSLTAEERLVMLRLLRRIRESANRFLDSD